MCYSLASIYELLTVELQSGVGSTIGAGIYILVGTVAREHSGPALFISFLIAGIAAALSAFCYAELASRCPSAGSAYHYSYICVGEGQVLVFSSTRAYLLLCQSLKDLVYILLSLYSKVMNKLTLCLVFQLPLQRVVGGSG